MQDSASDSGPGVTPKAARLRVRIILPAGGAFGPGKADLLAGIAERGSIAAAGRAMGMSYQRAWSLIEELNEIFNDRLVRVTRGGAQRGGATLTPVGEAVLAYYRNIEATATRTCEPDLIAMAGLVKEKESDIPAHR